jgi:hypothetical protein
MNTFLRILNTLILAGILTVLILMLERIPKEPITVRFMKTYTIPSLSD